MIKLRRSVHYENLFECWIQKAYGFFFLHKCLQRNLFAYFFFEFSRLLHTFETVLAQNRHAEKPFYFKHVFHTLKAIFGIIFYLYYMVSESTPPTIYSTINMGLGHLWTNLGKYFGSLSKFANLDRNFSAHFY